MLQDQDKDSDFSTALSAEVSTKADQKRRQEAQRTHSVTQSVDEEVSAPDEPELAKWLRSARITPTDHVTEPQACLAIEMNGELFTIGTLGNISTTTGKAKAKKTFAICIAIAAAVSAKLIIERIKGQLPEGKRTVLLFDTEQARHDVLRIVKRICLLCGIDDPPNLVVYSLRPFAPDDRLRLVDHAINNTPDVGLVVIDGIRDLAVDPVMDSTQASHILTHLLQWTDRLHIHVMCVLHQNKNDTTVRGFIGTELVNKSETVLSVTKCLEDKNTSTVAPEYCRGQEFEPFSFTIDANGQPALIDTPKKGKVGNAEEELTTEEVVNLFCRAFAKEKYLGYGQLRTAVIEAGLHYGKPLAKGKVEVLIQRKVSDGYLIKQKVNGRGHDKYSRITSDGNPF